MSRGMIQVPFGHTTVSRIAPLAGPQAYKTYSVVLPLATHWRDATCEEYGCEGWKYGFVTTLNLADAQGAILADLIRKGKTGRSFHEQRLTMELTKFIFPPGTPCFTGGHKVRIPRPEKFIVRDGDFRGNPTGNRRIHANGEDWAEDCAIHLDKVNTQRNRG